MLNVRIKGKKIIVFLTLLPMDFTALLQKMYIFFNVHIQSPYARMNKQYIHSGEGELFKVPPMRNAHRFRVVRKRPTD